MSSYNVTPGVIDGAAEHAFSYGACAGLAIAIHDATGWPLIKVTDADSVYGPDGYSDLTDADTADRGNLTNKAGIGAGGLHWGIAHPTGKFLDIDGLHEPADIVERYDDDADDGTAALGQTSRDDALDEYVSAKGEPVALDVCATFVEAVLSRI